MNSTERRLLLVASTGGHLTQLVRLAPRLAAGPRSEWVTFESPQSLQLLKNATVHFVPYIAPRDLRGTLRARKMIDQLLAVERFDGIVSTGAALAVAAFSAPRARQLERTYIESVSRVHGPSLSGRIISALGLASLHTQHRAWADGKWRYSGSVLDEYVPPAAGRPVEAPRLFVTLGTIRPYRFDSLVDAVLATGLVDERTVWQLGETTRQDLPGEVHRYMNPEEFNRAIADADVVVTHAGVGTILGLLELGVVPVVVPRRRFRGEHVDDHQTEIAALLVERKLGVVVDAEDLGVRHLQAASAFGGAR